MAKGSLRVNGIIVDTDGEIKASTGDAIVIREDDGSAVITVDTSGNTLINGDTFIGGNTSAETIVAGTPRVQVEGVGYADSSISVFSNSNDTSGSYLFIGKSRGTALSADTIVQDGDFVGGIEWVAADGTDRASRIAGIYGVVDGTPGANDTPGELTFYTTADGANSGTQKVVIKADGKVGIGVAVPGSLLSVGSVSLNNSGDTPLGKTASTNPAILINNSSHVNSESQILFGYNSGTETYAPVAISYKNTSASSKGKGDLLFALRDSTGDDVPVERMRITSAGSVGIGTTAPSTGLQVYDGTGVTTLTVSGSGTGYTNAELVLEALTGTNERGTGVFMHDAGGDIEWFMGRRYDSTDNFQIGRQASLASHNASVSQAANALLTIDNAGEVGIGTTAPGSRLHVYGTQSNNLVKIQASSNATNDLIGISFQGTGSYPEKARIVAKNINTGNNNAELLFFTGGWPTTTDVSQAMMINSGGLVGIGTTAPYSTLHVHGKAMGTFAMGECIYAKVITHQSNLALNASLGINHSELSQAGTVYHFRIYGAGAVLSDSINLTEILMVYRNDAYGTLKKILHQSGAQHSGSAGAHIHYDITNASSGNSGSAIMLTGSLQAGGSSSYDQHTYVTIHRMDCRSAGAMFKQS